MSIKSFYRLKCLFVLSEKCKNLWWSWRNFKLVAKEKIYFCPLLLVIILITRFYYKVYLYHEFLCLSLKAYLTITQVLKSRLFLDKFTESVQYTFLDYLSGGFELNFMVAIDFTGIPHILKHSVPNYFLDCSRCLHQGPQGLCMDDKDAMCS